jgi:Zn-dependent metalloprotease
MCHTRNPLHCIVPPFVLDKLAENDDGKVRDWARRNIEIAASARAKRSVLAFAPSLLVSASPQQRKHRLIYDAKNKTTLPGTLVRREGQGSTGDAAVTEAYRFSGLVYDFYDKIFDRNSLNDEGMTLVSTVHYGKQMANASWDGQQMA